MNPRTLLAGAGLGAAMTYMLDPDRGTRRRAFLADKATRAGRVTGEGLETTVRDMGNRARGVAAEARAFLWRGEPDNDRLVARVRSKLGRVCSHTQAIDVTVTDDRITLRGPILAREVPAVLATVQALARTRTVDNELEPHESAAGVPALQGSGRIPATQNITPRRWSPSTRALVAGGVVLTGAYLAARRSS